MRIFANTIPKSGTHLLLRLLTQMGFGQADFGGTRPRPVKNTHTPVDQLLGMLPGGRKPGQFLGVGPHLVEGGRFTAARAFFRNRDPEKVLLGVDIPGKVGRDWLRKRLAQVPEDHIVSAHCAYTPELAGLVADQGMRAVCMLRDPRDTVVSFLHYVKRRPKHPLHEEYIRLPNDHERLMFAIRGGRLGDHILLPLDERFRNFVGWEREAGAAMVKFEDLVGPKGGGSTEAQRSAIERVAGYLDVSLDEERTLSIADSLYGSGRTFRKGKSGGWRDEFSEEHVRAVEEVAGELLVDLGYETGCRVRPGRR